MTELHPHLGGARDGVLEGDMNAGTLAGLGGGVLLQRSAVSSSSRPALELRWLRRAMTSALPVPGLVPPSASRILLLVRP